MSTESTIFVPRFLNTFQGFSVIDIKEFISDRRIEIHLRRNANEKPICSRCGSELGHYHDRYHRKAKHLTLNGFKAEVHFFIELRHCLSCKKVRSEFISWICPTSPHITFDLAWTINRLSEIATVKQVAHFQSVDKMTCYKLDDYILTRMLQGYEIPKVTHIAVDEVYARSSQQQKENETRDDLFFTVIVDLKSHKVIWVSKSRRKDALDTFFAMIGEEACKKIKVVATDQHEGYGASVREHCPNARLVWDRFHLVQKFNDLLNEERKSEAERVGKREHYQGALNGRHKWIFLRKACSRNKSEIQHINEVMSLNQKIAKLEIIKEAFHLIFESQNIDEAEIKMYEVYQWCCNINCWKMAEYIQMLFKADQFRSYFEHRYTTAVVEGINRGIKTLKWVAYGYKNMSYFALKIMQKFGYLNHRYAGSWLSDCG